MARDAITDLPANIPSVPVRYTKSQLEQVAKSGFGNNLDLVAEVYIALGSKATVDQVAEKTGIAAAKVEELFVSKAFWESVKKRLIQRHFGPERFGDFVTLAMYNLSKEYQKAVEPEMLLGATPEFLEDRMLALKRIEKLGLEVYELGATVRTGDTEEQLEPPDVAMERLMDSEAFQYFRKNLEAAPTAAQLPAGSPGIALVPDDEEDDIAGSG